MDKTTPANFIWEKRKPQKWRAGSQTEKDPAQEMIDACKEAARFVWADSIEEAERMEKMSREELRAYLKEKDGTEL